MNTSVITAILKRNLVSYFSSPIGYVFICALVLMSAFAAFWPNEFFNANLANLDQLNRYLPWIMLVFVPAVTMSIWAGERQQGTDELLLTLPARDLDVVIGKYLAALLIFTIALGFSLSNIVVLIGLGDPDLGLLAANYIGYWCVGAAMLAVGMAASFLTSNLTIGFILGAAFNAPLAFAASADVIIPQPQIARFVESFSIAEQFRDFGRGLITLSAVVFFASIAVVMLYLAMVLIGRRHWTGRGTNMAAQYTVRCLALVAGAIGTNALAARYDMRVDITSEKLSSLSPHTTALLRSLDADRPVFIEAYVSPEVPQQYIQTRLNLISTLRAVDTIAGDAVVARIHETERFSEAAAEAEKQFGIQPRQVTAATSGKFSVEEIVMGVAFQSGLDRVVVPFFERGLPIEYEVVRSIATVSRQERLEVGIVATDAKLFGGFDMQTMSRRPDQAIVTELRKQYEVEPVNPTSEIGDDYDVLLAVQPSTLPQAQLDNLLAAIERGVPAAIFEDPLPLAFGEAAGTSRPRIPPGGNNPFQQQRQPPPEPKGDTGQLWETLQIDFSAGHVVWDRYNPYPRLSQYPPEFVFISPYSGTPSAFSSDSPVTDGLQQLLMVFAGSLSQRLGATLSFEPLMRAGSSTGLVAENEVITRNFLGGGGLNPNRRQVPTGEPYVMAARLRGLPDAGDATDGETADRKPIDVIFVADIDMLHSQFFAIRAQGQDEGTVGMDFDNVTFVLNVLDELAGEDRFIDIRKRRPAHRTLTTVEEATRSERAEADEARRLAVASFEEASEEAQAELERAVQALQERPGVDPQQMVLEIATKQRVEQQRLDARVAKLERERDEKIAETEMKLASNVRKTERKYKLLAVALPPIPPLVVAIVVFFRRRSLEKVGVPKARMRGARAPEHGAVAA